MVILAVDNDPEQLWELVKNLRKVYPGDTIEYTHDPFMAGRFGINNQVDVMFVRLEMKVSGVNLRDIICKRNANVQVVLMASAQEFNRWGINEEDSGFILLERPVSMTALRELLAREPCR